MRRCFLNCLFLTRYSILKILVIQSAYGRRASNEIALDGHIIYSFTNEIKWNCVCSIILQTFKGFWWYLKQTFILSDFFTLLKDNSNYNVCKIMITVVCWDDSTRFHNEASLVDTWNLEQGVILQAIIWHKNSPHPENV